MQEDQDDEQELPRIVITEGSLDSLPPPERRDIFLSMQHKLDNYFMPRAVLPQRPLSNILSRLGAVGLPPDGILFSQKEYDIGFAALALSAPRGRSLIESCLGDDQDALFHTRDEFLRLLDTLTALPMISIDIALAVFRFDPKAVQLWEDKVEVVVVDGLANVLR